MKNTGTHITCIKNFPFMHIVEQTEFAKNSARANNFEREKSPKKTAVTQDRFQLIVPVVVAE
jgi:hypothetical protein